MSNAATTLAERLDRARTRDADRVRADLRRGLAFIPPHGLIFTRAEVDAIAEALGGYTKLAEVLDGSR